MSDIGVRKVAWSHYQLIKFMSSLVDSLAYLHANGVIHSDIHTDNIMVTENNTPIIIDFGLACTPTTGTGCHNGGKVVYMAPELFNPSLTASATNKIDVYSLGMSFYWLLYNGLPFTFDHLYSYYMEMRNPLVVKKSHYPTLPQKSIDFLKKNYNFILKMIDPNAKTRPTITQVQKMISDELMASRAVDKGDWVVLE